MMLLELARRIIDPREGARLEDRIEAYQFLCDTWNLDHLPPYNQAEYNQLVELGLVHTVPFRAS